MHKDDNHVATVVGFVGVALVAAAAGAVTALLLAPKSGRETREDIRRATNDLKRQAGERFDDMRHHAEEGVDHLRTRATDVAHEVEGQARGLWKRR